MSSPKASLPFYLFLAACLVVWLQVVDVDASSTPRIKALIVDGQNNHSWTTTSPILKRILEDSGLFTVDVATSPARGMDMSRFRPRFGRYQVVVSNYNGDPWPEEARRDFVDFVSAGGGFVVVHAADNAFSDWPEYNEIIGLGGWGGRDERWGPYLRFREGKIVRDETPGSAGTHGSPHAFPIQIWQEHPITAGFPKAWMHGRDELYARLRGPARNLTILATASADSGEREPVLFVVQYKKGRVFHTTLGHGPEAMGSPDFVSTLQRGAEWAATGAVSQPASKDVSSLGTGLPDLLRTALDRPRIGKREVAAIAALALGVNSVSIIVLVVVLLLWRRLSAVERTLLHGPSARISQGESGERPLEPRTGRLSA